MDNYYADQEREAAVYDADPPFPVVDRTYTGDRPCRVFDIVVTIYDYIIILLYDFLYPFTFFSPFYFLLFFFIRRQFNYVCDPTRIYSSRLARYLDVRAAMSERMSL